MKKHLITGLFAALALTANAQSFKEWLDPEINAVNRAPMHTITLPMNRQMPPCRQESPIY